MKARTTTLAGFEAWELGTDELSLVVIPELGGKITSFVHRPSGFDFAYVNPQTGIVRYPYDAPYLTTDCGIGDLFPAIGVGVHGDGPWKGVPLPDKGEIWTQPMATRLEGECLASTCTGLRFPYRFTRRILLAGNEANLMYEVESLCDHDLRYQWSLQPHLRLEGRLHLRVPAGATFLVDWSKNGDFEPKTRYRWPDGAVRRSGARVDFSAIDEMDGNAEKLYLTDLPAGQVALEYLDRGLALVLGFDTRNTPHCGLWINREGWPLDREKTRLCAVQPCNCLSDFRETTESMGAIGVLPARSTQRWAVAMQVTSC